MNLQHFCVHIRKHTLIESFHHYVLYSYQCLCSNCRKVIENGISFRYFYILWCLMSKKRWKIMTQFESFHHYVLLSYQCLCSNCRKIVKKKRLFSDSWCPIKRGLIMIQFENHVDVGQVDPEFLMRFGLGDSSTSYHWPRGPRSISSSIVDGSSFIFFIGWALFPKRLISLHIPKLQP